MFRKADEMEMSIMHKSTRNAYIFILIYLFIWFTYDFIKTGSPFGRAFRLFMLANIIQFASRLYLEYKINKYNK